MGCKWCSSGLGRNCAGPIGMDDLEVGCNCECHVCDDCGSAYCINAGGIEFCESESDIYADYEPIHHDNEDTHRGR